jgi:hypothetical protein
MAIIWTDSVDSLSFKMLKIDFSLLFRNLLDHCSASDAKD